MNQGGVHGARRDQEGRGMYIYTNIRVKIMLEYYAFVTAVLDIPHVYILQVWRRTMIEFLTIVDVSWREMVIVPIFKKKKKKVRISIKVHRRVCISSTRSMSE
jgi:hypothetical protein